MKGKLSLDGLIEKSTSFSLKKESNQDHLSFWTYIATLIFMLAILVSLMIFVI